MQAHLQQSTYFTNRVENFCVARPCMLEWLKNLHTTQILSIQSVASVVSLTVPAIYVRYLLEKVSVLRSFARPYGYL